MNFIKRIIEHRKYKKSPEYISYLECLDLNRKDVIRLSGYYDACKTVYEEMLNNHIDQDSKEFLDAKEQMLRWYYAMCESIKQEDFIRPNSKEEIEDRQRIANTFGSSLKNIVGDESSLRFHGTPIYFAKDIIADGCISSTADRFDGYYKSTDLPGEFSASDIFSIERTINFFTDFGSYQRCLPCGVLFVIKEGEEDIELRQSATMKSFNFHDNPDRLVGILGTSEVKDMLLDWVNEAKMDTSKVFTYDEFLEYALNNNIESSKKL